MENQIINPNNELITPAMEKLINHFNHLYNYMNFTLINKTLICTMKIPEADIEDNFDLILEILQKAEKLLK